VRGPPGLELPPGLKRPWGGQSSQRKNSAAANTRKSFNVETKPIVSNTVGKKNNALAECLRQISTSEVDAVGKKNNTIAECLRQISTADIDAASNLEEFLKRRLERERSGSAKADLPPTLEKVLGKLTPEDAATVKAAVANGSSRKIVERSAPQYPRVANITDENSLRTNLRKLSTIDAKRVFTVRKISRLGLNSHETLKRYFSRFGVVDHVFVTHGIDKRIADAAAESHPRIRPAGSGFVVMGKVDDVVNIFKKGLEHDISGVRISVTAYEHQKPVDGNLVNKPSSQSSSENTIKPPQRRIPANVASTFTQDTSLRSNLQKMAEVDAKRIIMVKKIGKLGFGSAQFLKTYFRQFGGVTDVFVSHTFHRRGVCPENPYERPRPGSMGFIVMDKVEDVTVVFQKGLEHVVYGTTVSLSAYEHRTPEEYASCDEEANH
jgi:hypothetical protein